MKIAKILSNKTFLKSLEKISEHGTSFSAATSLVLSLSLRPIAINSTPNVENENKQYAMANSICSGLMKFAIVEAVALPIEHAIKKIDKNKTQYLSEKTIKSLSPKAYNFITQIIKLSVGFFTAIPKSVLTVALIPVITDKFFKQKSEISDNKNNSLTFTGKLPNNISRIIENKKIQNFAIKNQNKDKDIAKHITAGTDILLTTTSAVQINRNKNIKENRKKALIYNNVISTAATLTGGYAIDGLIKRKTSKFVEKFKQINSADPKLSKYVEGLNIIRPAIIFAGIYYGILPMFSTYMAEKIDKHINNTK